MPPPQTNIQEHSYPPRKYRWTVLAITMIGLFMAVLDGNIVNVALAHMMSSYSTNTDRIRWVVESYAISYAIFTLVTSWLREKTGIKYTIVSGLVIFTVSSALCGMAWSVESMIFFRILQGLGGGIMMPAGFTLITESFPPQQRGAAFGVFGIVIVFAPSVGPTLGGWLVDYMHWRYVFYINLPIGVLTIVLSMAIMKELKKLEPRPFDFWGFVGLSLFLGCLLVALTEGQAKGWNSDFILSLFGISAVGFALFIAVDLRAKYPIIDLTIFSNFYFSMLAILNLMRSVALFGRIFLLPLFFQNLIGYSATTTGLLLSPGAIIAGFVMPLTGPLVDRYGPRLFLYIGFPLFALSNFLYYNLDVATPYSQILWPMFIYGIGGGLLNSPITTGAMNAVRRDQIGQVSTILSVLMQVGGAFGIATLGTLVNSRAAFHQAVYAEAITAGSQTYQSALAGAQALGMRIGESQTLSAMQAPAIINAYITKQSIIAGYQDAFVYTGIVCMLALIPALGLLRMKHVRHTGGPTPAGE